VLGHAAAHVPFYRSALRGLEAEIETDPAAALRRLSPVTKETIRTRFADLCSDDLSKRRSYEQTSGGSTGEPVRFIQDMHFRDRDNAIQMLMSTWTGWKPGEREVMVVGSEREILENNLAFQARVSNRLMRRRYFNAFKLTSETMVACLEDLDRDPPKLIRGYSQSIDDLAAFAQREGISVAPQHAILSSAGMLYPSMRERMEAVFGCKVFNQYGSREVSGIACECEHQRGLHMFPWMNFVEIVDEDGNPVEPGVEGRVLVTALCNYAMPLIRFDIGDRAVLVPDDEPPCPCGRGGQRIGKVLGRTVDTFEAADGTLVSGSYFVHLLFFRDAITRFQIVQRAPARVTYRLVTTARLPEEDLTEIARDTQAVMGKGCKVEFEYVEEIAPSPSGKHRYTMREF
jgi:phenylacetate-CoA ligase